MRYEKDIVGRLLDDVQGENAALAAEAAHTIAVLRAERDRCRDRSVVVMIGDTGHYVSQAVADRLAALTFAEELIAKLGNERDVAEYKLDQAVNTVQPMIIRRAEAAEAKVKELEAALRNANTMYNGASTLNELAYERRDAAEARVKELEAEIESMYEDNAGASI
jgi:hypothetical protein